MEAPDRVVGTGLLVSTPQFGPCVLTAAHVVNFALGGDDPNEAPRPSAETIVRFDLPAAGRAREGGYAARVVEWAPAVPPNDRIKTPVSDIALLQVLEGDVQILPSSLRLPGAQDFRAWADDELVGRSVACFGFSRPAGAFAEGKLIGADASGWLHLVGTGDHGDFIAPGFSGAPVYEVLRRFILGLVVAVDGGGERLAFLQPAKNIRKACPQLAVPYRGLHAFEEEHAEFFFGRSRFVEDILRKAKTFPIVGVTAASGSGKSSALRAGVIPRMRAAGGALVVTMRPERDPWRQLGKALQQLVGPPIDPLEAEDRAAAMGLQLRSDPETLAGYAGTLTERAHVERLVIFVDQFEELFTLANHEQPEQLQAADDGQALPEQGRGDEGPKASKHSDFRDLMVATARLKGPAQIQWLYALRGDFTDRAFRHPDFAEAVADGNVMLADMREEDLRAAIERPAQALGVRFEGGVGAHPNLVWRIAADAGMTAGALPLMQHVLEQLWRGMADRTLTHAAYEALGGLDGSVDLHAERIYQGLAKERQDLVPRLLRRLLNVEEDGEVTRRVARRRELGEALWSIAVDLAGEEARLLTVGGETGRWDGAGEGATDAPIEAGLEAPGSADPTVEVSHEALLRSWKRMTEWITDDRRFLLWRRRLERLMKEEQFLSPTQLLVASGWLEARPADLTGDERIYIQRSQTRKDEEDRQEREQQEELETALATSRRNSRVAVVLALLGAIVAGIAVYFWVDARNQGDRVDDDAARYAGVIADSLLTQGRAVEALKVVSERLPGRYAESSLARKPVAYSGLSFAVSALEQRPDVFRGHSAIVVSASFSPDGMRILTVSSDKTARLWDVFSGRTLAMLRGHARPVTASSFSPDGTRVVTASSDMTARLWDASSGRELATLQGHEEAVNSTSFSPDGTRLVTTSWDETARLWDASSGRELAKLQGHKGAVNAASFSPDGTRVVTASWDTTARLWDASSGRELAKLQGHKGAVNTASFSPDGTRIVTTSFDQTAWLWDAASFREKATLRGHGDAVSAASFSPDGTRIVTASWDNTARLWEATNGRASAMLRGHDGPVTTASFSPDGTRIVTASQDKMGRLWDAVSGRELTMLRGHDGPVTAASFSPDGTRIVTASDDNTARLWDAASGGTLAELKGHGGFVLGASFSPDGTRIVTASWDGAALLWDAAGSSALAEFKEHMGSVNSASFSPDGTRIVTASLDGTARLWNASNGELLGKLEGHSKRVTAASFSPDGTRVVTASDDNTVLIWDAAICRELTRLEGHRSSVNSASFSPDGTRIVTASDDKTARLWDASSGRALATFEGHNGRVTAASFSPDGTRIVTASDDKTARLWNVSPATPQIDRKGHITWKIEAPFGQALLDRARLLARPGLTDQERRGILKEGYR